MPLPKRQNVYYQAQAILSRRDHSVREVELKLKRKGFSAAQINDAITALKKHRLLDDARFARIYIDSILLTKPVGPRYLKQKLQQKYLNPDIISAALETAFPSGREEELAQQAAHRWHRAHASSPDNQKLTRHLLSRGFSFNAIQKSLASYTSGV